MSILAIGNYIGKRRRIKKASGEETWYLLTAAKNRICTASGNRILWMNTETGYILAAGGATICTSAGNRLLWRN